jgi:hypothetical protein
MADGSLVASGSYLVPNIGRARDVERSKASTNSKDWQTDAANFVEVIGPLRYGEHRIADTVALGRLKVMEKGRAQQAEDGDLTAEEKAERLNLWSPSLNADAAKLVDDLHGDNGEGHDEILKMAALHLLIYGESYLIGQPNEETETWLWEFVSPEELTGQKGSYKRRTGGDDQTVASDDFVARMHNPDPRFSDRPDCALRSALPICGEIVGLQKYVDSVIESRLSAGILAVPNGIVESYDNAPSNESVSNDPDDADADEQPDFLTALAEHLIAPVEDRSDPASLVPMILTGEPEMLSAIRLIVLGSELDSYFSQLRQEAYSRLAQSLDLPPEIMEGKSASNHWSAFNIDADFVAKHVAPIGRRIATFLTRNYLRPMLIEFHSMSAEDAQRYRIDFDLDHLMKSQDEGAVALRMHEQVLLSDEAARRVNGFDESDAPAPEERVRRTFEKLMTALPSNIWPILKQLEGLEDLDIEVPDEAAPGAEAGGSLFEPGFGAALGGGGGAASSSSPGGDLGAVGAPPPPASFEEGGSAAPQLALLRERMLTGGDKDIRRALEVVGSRVLSQARKVEGLESKLRRVQKVDVLTHIRPADLTAMGINIESEWRTALEESARQARGWLAAYGVGVRGMDPEAAINWGDEVADRYLAMLIRRTANLAHRPVVCGPNGLLISAEDIDGVLANGPT